MKRLHFSPSCFSSLFPHGALIAVPSCVAQVYYGCRLLWSCRRGWKHWELTQPTAHTTAPRSKAVRGRRRRRKVHPWRAWENLCRWLWTPKKPRGPDFGWVSSILRSCPQTRQRKRATGNWRRRRRIFCPCWETTCWQRVRHFIWLGSQKRLRRGFFCFNSIFSLDDVACQCRTGGNKSSIVASVVFWFFLAELLISSCGILIVIFTGGLFIACQRRGTF